MRPPEFWSRPEPSPIARLLWPAGWLFEAAGRLRRMVTRPRAAAVPVICVGNLSLGGAGKTPVAMSLARRLRAAGRRPHILTRGYGGRFRGPVRVAPAVHGTAEVGDESLLLAAEAPVWVAADRVAGARAAVAAGADVLVMDDGFQNPSPRKDLSLVVVDGGVGFGNGLVAPAGPLRESVRRGLARADAIVLLGPVAGPVMARVASAAAGRRILRADLRPAAEAADRLAGRRVLGFAGIGRPAKFFETLRDLGADLAGTRAFADHHPYTGRDIDRIAAAAAQLDARPVTTAKDWVRVPETRRAGIEVLTVRVDWENETDLDPLLRPVIDPP